MKLYKVVEFNMSEEDVYIKKGKYEKQWIKDSQGEWRAIPDLNETIGIIAKEKERYMGINWMFGEIEILKDEQTEFAAQLTVTRVGESYKSLYFIKVIEIDMPFDVPIKK